MATKLFTMFRIFMLVSCLVFGCFAIECFSVQGQAAVQPEQAVPPAISDAASPENKSPQWRAFIWEALPAEWLSTPGRNIVVEAYKENDWRPFFMTSEFELSPDSRIFLQQLDKLDHEAIDSKAFKLDDMKQRIVNLEQLRASAKNLIPSLNDSITDFSVRLAHNASSPENPPDASQSRNVSDSNPQNPAPIQESEEKYRKLFYSASELDIRLASLFVRFSNEMDPFSEDDQVKALAGQIPMKEFLQKLEPASPHYQHLLQALSRYRNLATTVRQQPVRASATLKPGETGESIRDLQKRLQQEDFYKGEITGAYDSATQQAVKHFQASHQLDPDGSVGQRTREWMNVSFKEKADLIAQAVRQLRKSPTRHAERYVRINIPQFMLEYCKDGKTVSTHRVIVGRATGKKVKVRGKWMGENQTPTLTSNIEQIVINPRWYVSDRIRLELDGPAGADPAYFTRHGYVQMSSLYPWGKPRIFQKPGPTNPLGRIKFEFPNAYAVYLHDTPNKYLFQRARRDFSHGCIRVEKADQLTRSLLADDQNPAAAKTDSFLSSDRQVFLKLSQPVPIIIEYSPVSSADNGQVIFFGDPYGWLAENSSARG